MPPDSHDPAVLVAAALHAEDADALLARAEAAATTPRDRQLVAIAAAHLRGERDVVDALAFPDSVLAAWIADVSHRQTTEKERP